MEQINNPSPYVIPGFPLDKRPMIWERKRDLNLIELFDPIGAINVIMTIVYTHTRITPEQITGKSRKREIVQARHLTMYLSARYMCPTVGLNYVAGLLSKESKSTRDHSSVIHGRQSIEDMLTGKQKGPYALETVGYLHIIEKQLKQTIDESNRTYWKGRKR